MCVAKLSNAGTWSVAAFLWRHLVLSFYVLHMFSISVDILCTDGAVRLVGGVSKYNGRVEVCINKIWGTVCARGATSSDAQQICKSRGFGEQGEKVFVKSYVHKIMLVWSTSLT